MSYPVRSVAISNSARVNKVSVVLLETFQQERQKNMQSFYFSKKKCCSFPQTGESNIINLPAETWFIPLGNSTIFGAKDWTLLLQVRYLRAAITRSIVHIHHYFT